MNADRIEREVKISAPIERVWSVLTEPAHVGTWFGTGTPAEIDLRPGGVMVLDHGSYGTFPTLIVDVDPPRALSYRWASAYPGVLATADNSTLVEFTLEPAADGTLLRVVESGFDSLVIPPERESSAGYASHSEGWSGVAEKLAAFAEGADESPLMPVA
ncbi:MAG: polyketide cyclase [Acidimicrobiaceae bacterium]|nr:polyketide cyclase [Acidimicrobiaceae bacterium]